MAALFKMLVVGLSIVGLSACDEPQLSKPLIEAHRGGAAAFPENSMLAFEHSFYTAVPGIEFDVVVTKDEIPVINHDSWISPKRCTNTDGSPIDEDQLPIISEMNWEEIRSNYRCGGIAQAEFPDAETVAAPLITLSELLERAEDFPEVTLHYDVKFEPDYALSAEVTALSILQVVDEFSLINHQYITANRLEVLEQFHNHSDIELALDWPLFDEHLGGSSDTMTGLEAEYYGTFGLTNYISTIEEANVDGIGIPYQIIDRHQVDAANKAGFGVQVWTLNTPELLEIYCHWPVDVIITDIPEQAPCF